MVQGAEWEHAALLLAVLAPLVGVPLTVFTFYLKGLRDQQRSRSADFAERLAILDAAGQRLRDETTELRRDYATKEEWLRESMWARAQIERMAVAMTRVEAGLEQLAATPATAERAVRAVARLEQFLRRGTGAAVGADELVTSGEGRN